MSITVKDGRTSNTMKVDANFRAQTFSVISAEDRQENLNGNTWSVTTEVTPAGADDFFFYLKNTGVVAIHITDIRIKSSVITDITWHKVSGIPTFVAENPLVAVSRNFGSNKAPTATISEDTDITNLSDGGEVFFQRLDAANEMFHLRTTSNIIVTPGTAFALKSSVAGLIKGIVSIVEVAAN